MKTSLTYYLPFLLLLNSFQTFAQVPSISWSYDTNDAAFGQSAADDIDGDGLLEIVFGCYRNDSSIYALNGNDGSLLWKYNASPLGGHGCNDVAPIIYDINGDGKKEVIVPGSCNPKTFCFDGATGEVLWATNTRGSDSPPTIADLDGDGKPEILHGEFGGYVICLNGEDGTVAWEILVDANSWIQTSPTLVDLNADGQLDFVVATWNFDYKDSVFAYNGADQSLMWSYPIHDHIYHGTAVADFDDDGFPELIIGSYNDTLYCINGLDGTTRWKYKGPGGYIGSPAAIGDVDGDGSCDIVLTNGFKVTVLENDGTFKYDYNIPDYSSAFRGVALADVNNDNNLDIVFCSLSGKVIGLDGLDGTELWQVDLAAHYGDPLFELNHAPLIADFDKDGKLDVFVVGGYTNYPETEFNYGRAYMISIGPGQGPDWLMFQQDVRRQSSLCPFPFSAVDIKEEQLPQSITPLLYPNPATDYLTIELPQMANSVLNVIIYGANGQLMQEVESFDTQKTTLALENWSNGLYFYQIQYMDGGTATGKFVVSR